MELFRMTYPSRFLCFTFTDLVFQNKKGAQKRAPFLFILAYKGYVIR
jgi:hypothetical protein